MEKILRSDQILKRPLKRCLGVMTAWQSQSSCSSTWNETMNQHLHSCERWNSLTHFTLVTKQFQLVIEKKLKLEYSSNFKLLLLSEISVQFSHNLKIYTKHSVHLKIWKIKRKKIDTIFMLVETFSQQNRIQTNCCKQSNVKS